jgi:hypothetical protein
MLWGFDESKAGRLMQQRRSAFLASYDVILVVHQLVHQTTLATLRRSQDVVLIGAG